jgi:Mor family transcriptional regulator
MSKTKPAAPAPDDLPDDVLDDFTQRLIAVMPAMAEQVRKVSRAVRFDWAGESSLYIACMSGSMRSSRNEQILIEYKAGAHIGGLSRKWGISERQVLRIIKRPDVGCANDHQFKP